MMRYVLLVCVSGIIFTGCAAIEDYHYCFVNQRRAAGAWYASHSGPERREASRHYQDGWKKGYFDVSTGGCGEPPVIPPNRYWSTRYQNESGQAAIEDWYAGFQDGAIAAESTGSGAFHSIPTGPTVPTQTFGWLSPDMEGAVTGPFDEYHSSVEEPEHFLQPFETVSSWPPLPDINTNKTTVIPESLPAQNEAVPPAPAEVNTVPPVITEE